MRRYGRPGRDPASGYDAAGLVERGGYRHRAAAGCAASGQRGEDEHAGQFVGKLAMAISCGDVDQADTCPAWGNDRNVRKVQINPALHEWPFRCTKTGGERAGARSWFTPRTSVSEGSDLGTR